MARTRSAGVSNRPHHNHHQPIAGARLEIIMEGKRRAKLVPKGATAKKTVPRAVASKNRQAARKKATAAAVQAEEKEFTKAADRGATTQYDSDLDSATQALFEAHWTTPWTRYRYDDVGPHLMSLPGEVRDKVFGMVLPIDFDFRRRKMRGQDVQPTNVLVISEAFGVGTSRTRPPAKIKFHPLIRVCRQLRYEYGALIMTTNLFQWVIPRDWNPRQLTALTQHAASVGVPDFLLIMDPCAAHSMVLTSDRINRARRDNLWQWAKEVFYGFETRIPDGHFGAPSNLADSSDEELSGNDEVDILERALSHAICCRDRRRSWARCEKDLEEVWKGYRRMCTARSTRDSHFFEDLKDSDAYYDSDHSDDSADSD